MIIKAIEGSCLAASSNGGSAQKMAVEQTFGVYLGGIGPTMVRRKNKKAVSEFEDVAGTKRLVGRSNRNK